MQWTLQKLKLELLNPEFCKLIIGPYTTKIKVLTSKRVKCYDCVDCVYISITLQNSGKQFKKQGSFSADQRNFFILIVLKNKYRGTHRLFTRHG